MAEEWEMGHHFLGWTDGLGHADATLLPATYSPTKEKEIYEMRR